MLFGEKGVSLLPTQEPGWNLAPNCYLSFVGPDCELGTIAYDHKDPLIQDLVWVGNRLLLKVWEQQREITVQKGKNFQINFSSHCF